MVNQLPEKKTTLSVEDLKGLNIEQPFIYLTKVLGYNLDALKGDLEELKKYNEYRNRIAHNLGHIEIRTNKAESEQSRLFKFLASYKESIEINMPYGRVKITNKSFLIEFCDKAESFLMKAFKILQDEYKKG